MENESLINWLGRQFPLATINAGIDFVTLELNKNELLAILGELKNNAESKFDFLFCLTAVDRNPDIEVIYHLSSSELKHNLEVKVKLTDRENPNIDSVIELWRSAELFECELFDLFGIQFNNHACRRMFLSEDWIGYPLRKDYQDEINMVKL